LAQQRLEELRNPVLLENKHAFLEHLQNITNEFVQRLLRRLAER
jgi:hypothetical protein